MLAALPLVFALIGLTLYVALAGADFGAGIWQLLAGRGPDGERIREHAHDSMAPVWEANHVWLIFVITVFWTAYPVAFGSIASTLAIPLFIAAVGIILRGAAYALRSGASGRRELAGIDTLFALSSILTPFALGAAAGGIASRRVPVGNAAGHLFTSWLNPTSITVGAVAVTTGGYLAAVYLAADAAGHGDRDLERRFRARALVAGVVAGAIALAAIGVLEIDCHPLYRELVRPPALAAVIVSIVAGAATLALVWSRRFEAARYCAALATAAVVAGWALAQWPRVLPGLTVDRAAAPHDTLVAVVVAVLAGAAILFPSLGLLFRLTLKGRFHAAGSDEGPTARRPVRAPRLLARVAIACLIAGFGFLNVASAGWAHGLGVAFLFGFVVSGFLAVVPDAVAARG
jgi:cytochrome d ubiquinol oxidase subunit II